MKFLTEQEQQACGIVILGESKTIPDTSVSIKDIVNKYTLQSYDELMRVGMYDEEIGLNGLTDAQIVEQLEPLFNSIDFSEIDDISEVRNIMARGNAQLGAIQKALLTPKKIVNDVEVHEKTT